MRSIRHNDVIARACLFNVMVADVIKYYNNVHRRVLWGILCFALLFNALSPFGELRRKVHGISTRRLYWSGFCGTFKMTPFFYLVFSPKTECGDN